MHLDDLTGIFPYVYLFYFDAAGVNPSSIWGANLTFTMMAMHVIVVSRTT